MNNTNYIYDSYFLQQLALQKNKEILAKVILLDLQENPVETLEGRVSTGSINLSGTSAISRTCNLTLLATDQEINEYMWSQQSKFKLEIGLNNDISDLYPKTCWFKQGVYLITGFSASKTTNNCQVSIQGTDKMALLNGVYGGVIQASMDFGTIDDKGIIKKVPIKEIIREAVHEYALEPYSNIIINDVDDYGTELIEYYGDKDLFLISKGGSSEEALFQNNKINICFNGEIQYYDSNGEKVENISTLTNLPDEAFVKMFDVDTPYQNFEIGIIKDTKDDSEQQIFAAKVSGGQRESIGRKKTELTYAGDLVANIGDNIANAVLNKITSQMPSFEYFYNVDGQFIFQQKKRYKTAAKMSDNKEQIKDPLEPSFLFSNAELITNYSIAPDIKNIKNDFAIWSSRKVNDIDVLLYSRYALDTKPVFYKSPWPYSSNGIEKQILDLDNFYKDKWNDNNDILKLLFYFDEEQNDFIQITTTDIYNNLPLDTLIYYKYEEIKLTSEEYDWREIILRMAQDYKKMHIRDDFLLQIEKENPQYIGGITGYEQYYNDILKFFDEGPIKYKTNNIQYLGTNSSPLDLFNINKQEIYIDSPESITMWFDFQEPAGELEQFSVKQIGQRLYAKNENNLKVIDYKRIPNIAFVSLAENENAFTDEFLSTYSINNIPNIYQNIIGISDRGISIQEKIDELLNQYTYPIKSLTLTTLPLYWLQPNDIIFINDKDLPAISGKYMISSISIPLQYNQTSQITATKIIEE